jgi:DNA-binding GntR family transcriptional regulator
MARQRSGPAYKALAAALREQIRAGAFPPHQRLPTEATLVKDFSMSRQTVRQAFSELVAEGLVYRIPGRGSFAVASFSQEKYLRSLGSVDDLLALAVDTEMEVIQPLTTVVDVAAAGRLQLPTDEVAAGCFRRHHGNAPFSVTTIYLPPALGEQIRHDPRIAAVGARSRATIVGLIEEVSEHPVAGAHQSITAKIVDPETAGLIGCTPGDPGLGIDRVYFDREGRYVELAVSTFNIARYSYRLELRRTGN